jgi:hypothetical protein
VGIRTIKKMGHIGGVIVAIISSKLTNIAHEKKANG